MSITDKLKNALFEQPLPADPTVSRTPRAVPFDNTASPTEPVRFVPDQVLGGEMRKRLTDRRSTAAGWDKVTALRVACANLAPFISDEKQRIRAAVKTQNLDVVALIDCYTGVLNVLANEDVRFRKALAQEQSECKPRQDKDIQDAKAELAKAKQRVSDLNSQVEQLLSHADRAEEQWRAAEVAFASALADVREETNQELEQLKSLK